MIDERENFVFLMCLIILFRFFVRSDTTPFARFASKAARSTETNKLTQIII